VAEGLEIAEGSGVTTLGVTTTYFFEPTTLVNNGGERHYKKLC